MMKKGNTLVIVGIVLVCVITAIVIVYGVLSVVLGTRLGNNEEQFDALINENILSLDDIAMNLEASSVIGSIRIYGGQASISVDGNKLNVDITNKDITYSNVFTLDGNVLSTNLFNEEKLDDITIDILEEIYSMNYDNKEVISKYLKEVNTERYNLKNVGIEKDETSIKLNVSKKIEIIDFNSIYLTLSEIVQYKSKLERESLTTISNDNISMIKSGYDGKIVISIAEFDEITSSTYNSLVNVLAVMYDYEGFYKDFIYDNPTSRLTDKYEEDYELKINPAKEGYEKDILGEKPMVRLTIYGN